MIPTSNVSHTKFGAGLIVPRVPKLDESLSQKIRVLEASRERDDFTLTVYKKEHQTEGSIIQLGEIFSELREKGIPFVSLPDNLDSSWVYDLGRKISFEILNKVYPYLDPLPKGFREHLNISKPSGGTKQHYLKLSELELDRINSIAESKNLTFEVLEQYADR